MAEAGAVGCGVVTLGPVEEEAELMYQRWLSEGKHGDMAYLAKYDEVRHDPRLLLDGAKSMIVAAFSYYFDDDNGPAGMNRPNKPNGANKPNKIDNIESTDNTDHLKEADLPADGGGLRWARYALGRDYHEEVRERLGRVAEAITRETGATCRVTVDTAPLRERYWAVKAGVGFIGVNNQLIIPGAGSWCVLGEILTTLDLEPDQPNTDSCLGCMRCVRACPGHALDGHGGMDARRCRSYLSIEKKYQEGEEESMPPLGCRIYGCDICQEVCPHNVGVKSSEIENFRPRPAILALTREDILAMEQADFSRILSHSAIKRAKLAGLQRDARAARPSAEEATQPE